MTSAALIAVLALTFYLRLLYFGQIIDADVGNLGYLAWRMAEGEVLIDIEGPGKPPLYPMLYALFIKLFGPSPLGLKMFGTIFVLLGVLAIYWLANQAYGKRIGLLAALLFGVFSSGPMVEGGTVNLETVLHLPYILAIALFLRASSSRRLRWYLLAGLSAALATLVKQVGGVLFLVFLCYGISEWWRRGPSSAKQWLFRYLILGIGALAPVLGAITYYQFHGYTLYQLYDSMLGSNLRYIQRGHEYMSLINSFIFRLEFILQENSLLWVGAVLASAYLIWQIRRNRGQPSDQILLWWAFWSFAVLWGSGFFFPHYFLQIISPFSVLAAYGIMKIWELPKSLSPLPRFLVQGGLMILLLVMVTIFIRADYRYFFSFAPLERTSSQHQVPKGVSLLDDIYNFVQHEIAKYVRDHTDSNETIYVWGISPQIFFLAQRRAATRYRNNYGISMLVTDNMDKPLQTYSHTVMEDLRKSPPAYIVQIYPLGRFGELEAFVRDQYIMEENLEFYTPPYKIHLYHRRPEMRAIQNPR
jgi:4-amino-4-deoxy-L-arabinose transferase-like glycosyltransferase